MDSRGKSPVPGGLDLGALEELGKGLLSQVMSQNGVAQGQELPMDKLEAVGEQLLGKMLSKNSKNPGGLTGIMENVGKGLLNQMAAQDQNNPQASNNMAEMGMDLLKQVLPSADDKPKQ